MIYSLCLLVFTGCGKTYYSSTGKTALQFEMDKARCMNFANGAYGSQMPVDNSYNKYNFQGTTSNGTSYSGTAIQQPTQQQQITDLGNSMSNLANTISKNRAYEACLNNLGYYVKE